MLENRDVVSLNQLSYFYFKKIFLATSVLCVSLRRLLMWHSLVGTIVDAFWSASVFSLVL